MEKIEKNSMYIVLFLQVTLLLWHFTQEENETNNAQKDQVVAQVNNYNRRFSGEPRPVCTTSMLIWEGDTSRNQLN